MRGQSFLWLLIVLSAVASNAAADPAPPAAWFGGGNGLDAGMLLLTSQRMNLDDRAPTRGTTETWTLTLEPSGPERATSRRVLWRDQRSWNAGEVRVSPTTGRLHIRPEHDDAIVVLTWTETAQPRVETVCADIFKVGLSQAPAERPALQPFARLMRPRTEHSWKVSDVLLGDKGILVVLRGHPAAASQMYYIDLATAQWRDAGTGGGAVDGIVEPTITIISYEPLEHLTFPAPTSRPLPTKRSRP